jgi:hypothetical protein
MSGTTQDFNQVRTAFGADHALEHHAEAEQHHVHWRKPPARYEAIAIFIMLFIVAMMPLFSIAAR